MQRIDALPPTDSDPFLLRRKVFYALAGVFLVFLLSRAALLWWEYDRTLASEQRRAENLAHVLAEHLDRTFGAIGSAVNQLAVHSLRIGGTEAPPEEWSQVLDATLSGLSGVGSLNILDADGRVIMSTNPTVTGTSRRGRYLHRRLEGERNGDLVIGPPAPAEHVSGVRIPLGRSLHDEAGNFIGFIAGTFQPERLRGFYEAINVGPHGLIQLFNLDGDRLFSQPHANGIDGDSASNRTLLERSRNGGEGGFLRAPLEPGGETFLTAWRRLSESPLVVSVSIAGRDVLSDWHTELLTAGGTAGGMALMLTLAGAWITASSRAHARASAALSSNRAQLQAILDNSPSAIVLKDAAGRYLLANRTMQDWLSLPAEDILGKTAAAFFGEQTAGLAAEDEQRVTSAGEVTVREVELACPDGTTRRVMSVKFPVQLADDAAPCIGSIMTDVTASREAEEKLHQAQKMESIGQLTGGVAHDFNNLLTAIVGNLDLVLDRVTGDAVTHRHLITAIRAAERGGELTHRLLAFARRQPLKPSSVAVNRLIGECKELLQRTIGSQVAIGLFLREDVWPVFVDASQLENVLLNLAINARDAMPQGGRLTIETGNVELDEDYATRNPDVRPGPHVMISVSDSGIGIAPEVLAHVFEPFFTTKSQGKGTGLGLSMVYGFAKQSGGHIRIYSEPGKGATVKLYLPRATSAEGAGEHRPHLPPGPAPGGSETILVVEDDPDVAAFTTAALDSLGYRVVQAVDGPSALACLEAIPRIDLLLTDVVLPGGMDGRDVAEQVQAACPGAKVLFISGYAESIIVHQGRLDAGVDFLAKPFARAALAWKVRECLDKPQSWRAGAT